MNTRRGRPRELTQAQIRRVLLWHRRRMAFQRRAGSLRSFAKSYGVAVHILRRALRGNVSGLEGHTEQVKSAVNRWVRRYRKFLATDLSGGELAAQLGVSRFTVYDCVRRSGLYKRSIRSSEPKSRPSKARTAPLSRRATPEETARRASALRNWGRVPGIPSPPDPLALKGLSKPLL